MPPSRTFEFRLKDADWLRRAETQAVFAALANAGLEARAVGGAVRNALIGKPAKDVDLATPALPEAVIAAAEGAGLKAVPTGLEHGTVTIVAGHHAIEVTTLRQDIETDGRRAKVAFSADWAADARRRDFTINALYCDGQGTVHDPLGGMADLEQGRVVFIGDARERIREDYLRILRFFRFSAEYAGGICDATGLAACAAERAGLARLSAERLRAELLRLLAAPHAEAVVATMLGHGFLAELLGAAPHPQVLHRLIAWDEAARRAPDSILRLGALALSVAEDAERLGARLRLSNAEIVRLENVADRGAPSDSPLPEAAAKVLLYRLGADRFRERMLFAWMKSGAPIRDSAWVTCLALPERWAAPKFPLSGGDLLDLGMSAGPALGARLGQLENEWIASGFSPSRDELLAEARAALQHKT